MDLNKQTPKKCDYAGRQLTVGWNNNGIVQYHRSTDKITCPSCGKKLKASTMLGEVETSTRTRLFMIIRFHKAKI